jgi:hypothetical protein
MMKPTDLYRRFHVDQLPNWELRFVLEMHFGGATTGADDEIIYTKDGQSMLTARYSKGKIVELLPTPALQSSDVSEIADKIEADVLDKSMGRKVRRDFIFCTQPTVGRWRHRESLQILPPPDDAPRPPWAMGEHPAVLEVPYEESPDTTISLCRAAQAIYEASLVLSGVIPSIWAQRGWRAQQQWAILMEGDETSERPVWTQPTYFVKGFSHVADDFTSKPGPSLNLVADEEFFVPWHSAAGENFDLPASIGAVLDALEMLDSDRRDRFIRWCYWLNFSKLSGAISMSASYTAIIQAVEAVRPDVPRDRCDECGRLGDPGPTRQFIEFMERYVPRQEGETERARSKLYALRSALTHGGKLFEWDLQFGFGSFHPSAVNESESARRASLLARLAGINWLLAGGS